MFPESVGAVSRPRASEAIAMEKCPPNRPFPAGWQSYLPWKKERNPQRLCFHASNLQPVFCFSDVRPPDLV